MPLAEIQDRDRTSLINEALDYYYLELQQYYVELIQNGIREADSGQLVEHSDVRKMVEKLKHRK